MTTEDKDKILLRVKHLLALAGNNPSEQEAARAAEKAQAILAQHNLSMSEVDLADRSDDKVEIDQEIKLNAFPWRRNLAHAVAQLYFCQYFYMHHHKIGGNARAGHDSHHFVGAPHNIAVAKVMFTYLNETVDRLARDGAKKHSGSRSSYITSFTNACASRLCHRIAQRIAETKKGGVVKAENGSNLPALADLYDQTNRKLTEFIAENVGQLKSKKDRSRITNVEGMLDGRAAGDKIGLDQQVGGGASKAKRIK